LIVLVGLLGCQKPDTNNSSKNNNLQKVTIAYTSQPQSTLVHIAKFKGYFAKEGLDVNSQMHSFGKMALQSLLDKKADIATVAETPLMFNILNGKKIFILATIVASTKNNAIVARKVSGILKAGDLKGKKVGYTSSTTSDFFLDSFLIANGLTRKDIQAIPLKPDEMQAAIVGKKVDAVSTWNYTLTQIMHELGKDGVQFFDQEIYTETFNLVSVQEFTQKNPEVIKKILRAVIKAQDFVKNNPAEAQAILSSLTKYPLDLIKEVWDAFRFNVSLDQTILITLEDEARWAIKNKLTEQTTMPVFLDSLYLDGLNSVNPEYVKITK